jgi:hypothetical protein
MAELNNDILKSGEGNEIVKVDIEMLDYAYVQDCKDFLQVSSILDVLKSGKEGHYPDVSLNICASIY